MERLTNRRDYGITMAPGYDFSIDPDDYDLVQKILTKLAAYEDLEAQGRLMVLPCPMGGTIYMIVTKRPKMTAPPFSFIKVTELMPSNLLRVLADFGKTVFLTREEAERALEEQK